MNKNDPIGVFDSGLGGLSVAAEIRALMPNEQIIYFGDSAHNPYGTKSPEQITEYCLQICDDFMKQNVKAIVIACNTATSACVPLLRSRYPIDIIGMEPALKVAASLGEHQKIAVWATELTLQEEKFQHLLERFDQDHDIVRVPCPKLVELVESDRLDDEEVTKVLQEYLSQSHDGQPDSIVLGCTHFVFFGQKLRNLCDGRVKIVDGNMGTARHLQDLLESKDLLAEGAGSVQIENSNPAKLDLSQKLLHRLEDLHEQ